LWRIGAGQRFEYSDPKLIKLMEMTSELILSFGPRPNIGRLFAVLRNTFPFLDDLKEQEETFREIKVHLEKTIKEHRKDFAPENTTDFIDAYLKEVNISIG
jgi:hypothetical protein